MEPYLLNLPWNYALDMLKVRTRNIKLPVCRWHNGQSTNTDCPLCGNNVADEFHFIMKCPYFQTDRLKIINSTSLYNYAGNLEFDMIMNSEILCVHLANFCKNLRIVLKQLCN